MLCSFPDWFVFALLACIVVGAFYIGFIADVD